MVAANAHNGMWSPAGFTKQPTGLSLPLAGTLVVGNGALSLLFTYLRIAIPMERTHPAFVKLPDKSLSLIS